MPTDPYYTESKEGVIHLLNMADDDDCPLSVHIQMDGRLANVTIHSKDKPLSEMLKNK